MANHFTKTKIWNKINRLMVSDLEEKIEFDREKIRNSVKLQMPIEITTYTLSRNMEIYIYDILTAFLEECHQEHLIQNLKYCLGELLTNAKKANTKRVYFKEKGLNINNPEEYEKGMDQFKVDTLSNIDHYLELQKKAGLYIKVLLQMCGRTIKIQIKNKAVLTLDEEKKIRSKIQHAKRFNSIEEVYATALDPSEGAGLGIIIIILMLQKVGLGKDNYKCYSTDKETITEIILPCNEVIYSAIQMITYEFINLQEQIPIRLAAYRQARTILDKADVNREALLKIIMKDDTLALLILKNTVDNEREQLDLKRAIAQFSDEQLRKIISSENSEVEIMEFNDLESEKYHSQKVAFYTYNLCTNSPHYGEIFSAEEYYTLGLINNIGFELLRNPTQLQEQYVKNLSEQYEESEKIRTVFYSGNACSFISYGYLKKLKFSEETLSIVGGWNNSSFVVERMRKYLPPLYMAEVLFAYSQKQLDFYQIDSKYLAQFDIYTEDQFVYILNKLDDAFNSEN